MDKRYATAVIRKRWPDAEDIRYEGECHICENASRWSFILPKFASVDLNEATGLLVENAGELCLCCGYDDTFGRIIGNDAR